MTRFLDWLLDPLRFRKKPKDRWPAWRPDQILTPENRSMTGLGRYTYVEQFGPTQTTLDVLASRDRGD